MEKPIVTNVCSKNAVVIYQQVGDGVGEPALLVEYYSDSVSITQGDDCILINRETVGELCKLLKTPKS